MPTQFDPIVIEGQVAHQIHNDLVRAEEIVQQLAANSMSNLPTEFPVVQQLAAAVQGARETVGQLLEHPPLPSAPGATGTTGQEGLVQDVPDSELPTTVDFAFTATPEDLEALTPEAALNLLRRNAGLPELEVEKPVEEKPKAKPRKNAANEPAPSTEGGPDTAPADAADQPSEQ